MAAPRSYQSDSISANKSASMLFAVGDNVKGQLGVAHYAHAHALKGHLNDGDDSKQQLSHADLTPQTVHSGKCFTIISSAERAVVFGANSFGQCAVGSDEKAIECGAIDFFATRGIDIKQISTNPFSRHSLFTTSKGVYGAGWNEKGQLGLPHKKDQRTPTHIEALKDAVIVDARCGFAHSLALDDKGRVYSAGSSASAVCGHAGASKSGWNVITFDTFKWERKRRQIRIRQIAAGHWHSLFLDVDGAVWSCGNNGKGQHGDGGTTTYGMAPPGPNRIFQEKKVQVIKIATGAHHNLAIDSEHRVYSWGSNEYGQCGTKGSDVITKPTLIPSLKGVRVVDIKCGESHSMVETEDGKYFLFGYNGHNEVTLRKNEAKKIYKPTALDISMFQSGLEVVRVDLGLACTWIWVGFDLTVATELQKQMRTMVDTAPRKFVDDCGKLGVDGYRFQAWLSLTFGDKWRTVLLKEECETIQDILLLKDAEIDEMASQNAQLGVGPVAQIKRRVRELQTPNFVETQTKQDFMASIAGLGEEWAEILEKEGFENDHDLLALTDSDIAKYCQKHGLKSRKKRRLDFHIEKLKSLLRPEVPTIEQPKEENISEEKCSEAASPNDACSNALVLLMGISKYEHIPTLHGVRKDMAKHRDLWSKQYGYDVFPTEADKEWYGKEKWSHKDIHRFMEQGRERLKDDDGQLRYDSLIVVICGHGGEGVIVPSDYHQSRNKKTVNIPTLHAQVGRSWNFDVAEIPRLFIIDCCRGNQFGGSVKRGSAAVGHTNDLLLTMYGNSPGIEVQEDSEGGLLSQCLQRVFADNIEKGGSLLKVQVAASRNLKEMSGHDQLLDVNGDVQVQTKVFVPRNMGRGAGGRAHQGGAAGLFVCGVCQLKFTSGMQLQAHEKKMHAK